MKKKVIIPYKHNLVEKARQLRNNAAFSERLLWKHLKGKQIEGYDFDRQKPMGKYIVDFFCNELILVIETDGITHNDKLNYDIKRQNDLEMLALNILRFNALDIVQNTQGVLDEIYWWINENRRPTPNPSQEGRVLQIKKLNAERAKNAKFFKRNLNIAIRNI